MDDRLLEVLLTLGIALAIANAEVFLKEEFSDGDAWKDNWVQSKHKSDYGDFVLTAGKFYGDAEADKGLKTSQDAKFYSLSRKFDSFDNEGKTLVLQFSVKHEQNIDCGGGYIKLMPGDTDQADFHGESKYNIMFGPDICGPGTKKVHVIFNYKGKNLLTKKDIRCKDDEYSHVYTLILKPDNSYEVKIDNEKVESGELEADWDFLPPKKIKDPDAKKPEDWDDKEMMDDPEDKKPEDWDQPEHIPDPDAKKPEDWDDEMDGEWEPPQIDNPDYKGEWKPRQIKNPNYSGVWVHPEIDNPEYTADPNLYHFSDSGVVGFDLWQVKAGTIFDNIFVGDSEEEAKEFAEATWGKTKDAEKKMKESQDEEERKKMEKEEEERKEKDKEEGKDEEEEEEAKDEEEEDKAEDEEEEEEEKKDTKDEL
jgi:calreticulin